MAEEKQTDSKNTSAGMKAFLLFLISKSFWKNVIIMAVISLLVIILIQQGLKIYTRHGQKIPMPDYVGESIQSASEDAESRSFSIIPSDSIYIVGRRGGIILNQIPEAQDLVKEGRKIYATITKYKPDMVRMEELPPLYGRSFERTARVLKMAHSIESKVAGRIYDPGPEGYIMGAIYEGDTILFRGEKTGNIQIPVGATMNFIISEKRGGMVEIPDLVCRTFDEAEFIIRSYKLRVGSTQLNSEIEDLQRAFIAEQNPAYDADQKIEMGSSIDLILVREKPAICDESGGEF